MRTSRASKETAKVLQALSPPPHRRTRNSSLNANALKTFAYNANPQVNPQSAVKSDDESSLSSANTADIEDLLEPPSKRRKNNTAQSTVIRKPRSTPSKAAVKPKSDENQPPAYSRRLPARKQCGADGSVTVEPPSNWEAMYNLVKQMREENPTAPVDTMGCAELYWRASSPRDRRFQTLVALMLSSQTKDTVTAVAMQRLHTELGDVPADDMKAEVEEDHLSEFTKIKSEEDGDDKKLPVSKDSTLNLENILAVSPTRLNELIHTIGFHNNKTKYIKSAALILRDEHNSDIPSTPEALMALPGVGPKMAYLCMSAAWGRHEGIGVDVHVHRITNLWGWHKTKSPEETRKALQSWLPRDKWHEINKLLVGLGQTVCLPVKKRCGDCCLAGTKLCKSEIKGLSRTGIVVKKASPREEEPKVKVEIS